MIRALGNPITGGLTTASVAFESPHRIFDMGADDVAQGKQLEGARETSFRYLVATAQTPFAAAEIQVGSDGMANLLVNFNFGPFVEATAHALSALANRPSLIGESYEFRVLRIAALNVLAVWLNRAPDFVGDWLYPLAPSPPDLPAATLYTPSDFFTKIKDLAIKRSAPGRSSVP
jgi:hypothetical protein